MVAPIDRVSEICRRRCAQLHRSTVLWRDSLLRKDRRLKERTNMARDLPKVNDATRCKWANMAWQQRLHPLPARALLCPLSSGDVASSNRTVRDGLRQGDAHSRTPVTWGKALGSRARQEPYMKSGLLCTLLDTSTLNFFGAPLILKQPCRYLFGTPSVFFIPQPQHFY
jgi:hypothetical protein